MIDVDAFPDSSRGSPEAPGTSDAQTHSLYHAIADAANVIDVDALPDPKGMLNISWLSPPHPLTHSFTEKRYTRHFTFSATGEEVIEFDSDSDGSV